MKGIINLSSFEKFRTLIRLRSLYCVKQKRVFLAKFHTNSILYEYSSCKHSNNAIKQLLLLVLKIINQTFSIKKISKLFTYSNFHNVLSFGTLSLGPQLWKIIYPASLLAQVPQNFSKVEFISEYNNFEVSKNKKNSKLFAFLFKAL